MERDLKRELQIWSSKEEHLPLLIRGARQVGKSYLVEQFGRESFESFVSINFELRPDYGNCFQGSLDPTDILPRLQALCKARIIPGKTLLFFDEIQYCPRAIMALRYFKERMPELHVISAGSLLELIPLVTEKSVADCIGLAANFLPSLASCSGAMPLAPEQKICAASLSSSQFFNPSRYTIQDEKFSFPVERVQFLYLKPLSFKEFLKATGDERFVGLLEQTNLKNSLEP